MTGIEVEAVYNGKEALEILNERPVGYYDLIFMDIQMPVMNGYEATTAIRESDRDDLKNIPIVAMTADAFVSDVKRAEDMGMNGHISKPVDLGKLEETLRKWL
jgi:CheY-like chemotaxis protein